MKCPYIVDMTIITQLSYDRNEAGETDLVQSIETQTNNPIDCLGCECAAWDDGRCKYKC